MTFKLKTLLLKSVRFFFLDFFSSIFFFISIFLDGKSVEFSECEQTKRTFKKYFSSETQYICFRLENNRRGKKTWEMRKQYLLQCRYANYESNRTQLIFNRVSFLFFISFYFSTFIPFLVLAFSYVFSRKVPTRVLIIFLMVVQRVLSRIARVVIQIRVATRPRQLRTLLLLISFLPLLPTHRRLVMKLLPTRQRES